MKEHIYPLIIVYQERLYPLLNLIAVDAVKIINKIFYNDDICIQVQNTVMFIIVGDDNDYLCTPPLIIISLSCAIER
jgi:hypothetical protein